MGSQPVPSPAYRAGFSDQPNEISLDELPTVGQLPTWLEGDLIRNGPAKFTVGDRRMNHWFDGLAMLHRFSFKSGSVSYANRYLRSRDYEAAEQGKISYQEFATDPCKSLFKRVTQNFSPKFGGNANVNIAKVGDDFVAMTEIPMQLAFDSKTLDTLGVVEYTDELGGFVTTAHPHFDAGTQSLLNYLVKFGPRSTYNIFSLPNGLKKRELIASIRTSKPSYMHSFAMTERHVVLMEFPFVVDPIALLLGGRPFIDNYHWNPRRGTNFTIADIKTGRVDQLHTDEAWFAFHHVNAFESDGQIHVDVLVYDDADIVQFLYLDSLLDANNPNSLPLAYLRRFSLSLVTGGVTSRQLSDQPLELPRINYSSRNGTDYEYVYGMGVNSDGSSDFLDRICKIDVNNGQAITWLAAGCYPGEPVFVASPGATAEDDGVLLSVVLDSSNNDSFMVVLDARDLTEIARATVPQTIPFGFHGQFHPSR